MNRLPAAALVALTLVGCGSPPGGGGVSSPGGTPSSVTRSEQKRAVAGKEASTVGVIKCEVLSWKVERPQTKKGQALEQDYLTVRVRFSTDDDTVSKNATIWLVEAKDDFGNEVDYHNHASGNILGDDRGGTVRAGQPVLAVVTLLPPVPKATRVDLDIPAKAAGLSGNEGDAFRFTIPLK